MLVNASFTTAAPMKFEGVDCLAQKARVGLISRLGGVTCGSTAMGDMS
jgi:hypothetical protein